MKHSRAALGVLKNRYISVLKKCALINTAFLLMVPPAAAVDVGSMNEFKDAIGAEGETKEIVLTGDIERTVLSGNDMPELVGSNVTIQGNGHILDGWRSLNLNDPIIVAANQTLTINNLIEQRFSHFLNNSGTVNIVDSEINSNNVESSSLGNQRPTGGAIVNQEDARLNIINTAFNNNTTDGNGGAILNIGGTVYAEGTTFSGNSSNTHGGAINNYASNGGGITTLVDSSFSNNYSNKNGQDSAYVGGAIFNGGDPDIEPEYNGTINIAAINANVKFTGNYVQDYSGGNNQSNAIVSNGVVNLNAADGKSIVFNDTISGMLSSDAEHKTTGIININGAATWQNAAGETITAPTDGTIEINNYVFDQTVNLYNGTLKFGYYDGGEDWQNGIGGFDRGTVTFNVYGGTISSQDGVGRYQTGVWRPNNTGSLQDINGGPIQLGQTTLENDLKLAIDAIAAGQENGHDVGADMFRTDGFDAKGHKVILSDINLGANTQYNGTAVTLDYTDWEGIFADENTKLQSTAEDFAKMNHLLAWNKDTGILKVGAFTLQDAVAETSGERYYTLNSTENVTENLGEMLDTGSLTIVGNNKNITASGENIGGITVGTGDTLEINDVAAMQGFDTALNVTDGTVSLDNSDITNNATGLSVSDGSVTLTDSNITGNTTGLTVAGGTVNINASAGDSAESLNTVTIDNAVGENVNNIENNGTINFNAFANAVIEVADNVIGTVGNLVNNALNINTAENASGTVNLANVEGQTVNINKGTVTMDKATGSDVNITTGDIAIAAVDNSTVDVADGTAAFGTVSNNSTITIAAGTADFNDDITSSTLNLNGGTNTIADGKTVSHSTINVATGATANIAADLNDSDITTAGNTTISGDVTNTSTVTANANTTISGAVSDSTVNANGGKTTISAAVDDSTLSVGTNGVLEVSGDITGEYTGNAYTTRIINSGTAEISGNVDGANIASIGNATTNLTGDKVENSAIFAGSTVNLGAKDGSISLAGSTIKGSSANLTAATVTGAFTIAENAALNTAQDATIAASINGSGTISNTGGELNFDADNGATGAGFTGTINATAGTIKLGADYGLNKDANINLSNSTLDYTANDGNTLSNDTLFNLALNDNATANITGTGRDSSKITLTDKFWTMGADTANNTLNFKDANYIFADGFTTGGDTVRFDNADISLKGTNYENSNLTLNNSALQLSNHAAGNTYTFGNLVSEGTDNDFSVDVDLTTKEADKIIYGKGSSGLLNLTELFITDDSGQITADNPAIIQLLDGNGNLKLQTGNDLEVLSWATNVYEYGVDSAETKSEADSIKISLERPSSTDTLRDLNRYNINNDNENVNHNRGFSFITGVDGEGKPIANEYHIYRDLDTTATGNFTILGRVENEAKSVLSGKLEDLTVADDNTRLTENIDGTYNYDNLDGTKEENVSATEANDEVTFAVGAMGNDSGEDARGSMFELVNATNLKISNVSVEDALRKADDAIKHGAAIYANNEKAEVTLENTDFKNNSVEGGNGGAIANIKSAVFKIANAIFSGNEASANGGAIYNADEMTLANAEFSGNKAANGGAIYNDTAGTMTINGATFENNATGTDGKGGAIYNAGTMTFAGEVTLAAATTAEDGTVTASNDIYNVGTLNLNGTTELNSAVTNDETLKVNGKTTLNNKISGTGDMFVNSSELELADTATIAQNTLTLAEAVKLAVNADQLKISEALNNAGTLTFTGGTNTSAITGEGTLNITGNVINNATIGQDALTIAATTGSLTTNAGNLILADNSITNNGLLTFTGGTNNNAVSGSGTTTISGTVTNEAKIEQGSLTIAEKDGRLTTNADNLILADKSITNNGALTFTGGNNGNAVNNTGNLVFNGATANSGAITGAGNTTIQSGTVENTGSITQNGLSIAQNAGLTTNADNLILADNGITNNGKLTFTGGNNKNAITNNGTMEYQGMGTNTGAITGTGELTVTIAENGGLTNSAEIKQNNIAFNGNGTVTNNASISATDGTITVGKDIKVNNNENGALSGNITNSGSINNGTLSGTITNTGSISNASVTAKDGSSNSGKISLALGEALLAEGNFTNEAEAVIKGSVTANSGTFTNDGEINTGNNGGVKITSAAEFANNDTIMGDVTNSGKFSNTGTVSGMITNLGTLENSVNGKLIDVENSGTFTNTGTVSGTIVNAGRLENTGTIANLNNEKDATATTAFSGITGSIDNDGTLNLTEKSLELGKTIAGAGTTNLAQNSVLTFGNNAQVEGTLNLNNTTINMQEKQSPYEFDTVNIGNLTGNGSLNIDISLDKGDNAAGKSDVINLTNGVGNRGSLTLTSVNVTEDGDADYVSYLTGNTAGLDLKLNDDEQAIATVTNDYAYVFAADGKGNLNVEQVTLDTGKSNTLKDFIEGTLAIEENIDATTYSMTDDITITAEERSFGSTGTDTDSNTLYLNQNGHTLSGTLNGDKYNGITVGTNDTLNVNSTGAGGTISGFETAFAVEETGMLNISNTTFKDNITDIANNGTLNATNIISSNIVNNNTAVFNGSNTLGNVTGTDGQMTIAGQTTVTGNIEQTKVTVNTGAGLAANLNDYTVATTENNGALTLNGDGTLGNISGTGNLSLNGAVKVNSGTSITQEKINLSGTADKQAALTNNGDISSAIIVNENGSVSGEGAMALLGGSENKGTISQTSIAIKGNTVNAGEISGNSLSVAENVLVTNTGGALSGNITNNGTINNGTINNGTVSGTVANAGTITGGFVAAKDGSSNSGTISAALDTAGAFTNAESGSITGDVTVSSGSTFANNGSLANIANSGTLNNTGTITGNVVNNGTLDNTGTIGGDVTNSGTLDNTGTIGGAVTNSSGATLNSKLAVIGGSLTNNGTFNMADASITLDKTIAGSGLTNISGSVTLGDNGGFAASQDVAVNRGATLDIGTKTVELDGFTLNGQLNLAIDDVDAGSSDYEGGKLVVNSANLEGGTMQFTVARGLLSGKQQTGELEIVDLKDDDTGSISGNLASIFEKNNLYEITKGEKEGTVIITNIATAEEVITGIGNQNQINTAGGWENAVLDEDSAGGKIQEALNTLVQHDIPEYLEALTNLAPTDSQFRLQTAKEAQNLIGRQIALRLDSSDCPTCKDPFRKTAMWMQGLGGYAKQDNRFDAAGYSAYTGGYAIGYDGNVNCDTVVGFGYANTNTDGESHGRDMDVSAHNLFAYGKYQPSEWYLRGAFNYGAAKYDEKSDVAGHNVSAKYDVHYTGLEAAVGYDMANGLTPEFGLRTTYLMPDDYEDSVGQKVNNKDIFAVTAAALLKYRTSFELDEHTVRPNVYAGLTYDLTDDGTDTAVNIGGVNYDIIGKRLPRLGGEAGMALEISHDNMDFSVGYDLGYKEDYISHTGMIKFRYNFN